MSLDKKVKQWLTEDETLEFVLAEQRGFFSRRCIAITSQRAIKFKRSLFGMMTDESDKQWRQLIDVHLKEHFRYANIVLVFFHYPDSIVHHNPHDSERTACEVDGWKLRYLVRSEAKEAYRILKQKEFEWKGKRREEQLEYDKAIGGKYIQVDPLNNSGDGK